MGIVDASVNVFSGIKGLFYLLTAILALIPMYKIYDAIHGLGGSTLLSITMAIIFWLVAFAVVYVGTEQIMNRGKQLTNEDHRRLI